MGNISAEDQLADDVERALSRFLGEDGLKLPTNEWREIARLFAEACQETGVSQVQPTNEPPNGFSVAWNARILATTLGELIEAFGAVIE